MGSSRGFHDIDSALIKKGFTKTKDGDHIRYYLYDRDAGATLAQTKMSHGTKIIGAPLIAQMARQLHLSKTQFLELIDCTLTEEQYRAILQNRTP